MRITDCIIGILTHLRRGLRGVVVAVLLSLLVPTLPAFADETLEAANTALIQGKHKDVIKLVGQVVAKGKQKPEVMARALLIRGISYRAQGRISQAIADFSNAEWLQMLRGVELRRLYAERALAYEAVGQKTLAAKDRSLAGSSSLETAKRSSGDVSSGQNGVRVTSVPEKQSTTSEFFGGLGNLFGFNNGQKKQSSEIKTRVVAKSASDPSLREIPTLDSEQAKANRAKLEGKPVAETQVAETKVQTEVKPSNSAWVQRQQENAKNFPPAGGQKIVAAGGQKIAAEPNNTEKEVLPWAVASNEKTPPAPPQAQVKSADDGPIELAPASSKKETPTNSVTSFFQNIFTGSKEKEQEAPVNPGDDVISADQVTSLDNSKAAPIGGEKKTAVKTPPPVRKPVERKAAAPQKKNPPKQVAAAQPQARSLYHIQLGVFGEAQAADKFVSRLNQKFKPVIGNKTAMVVETDLGQNRRQYLVYLGPFRSRDKGLRSCKTLTSLGMGCRLVE